jgi:hypothetical protein
MPDYVRDISVNAFNHTLLTLEKAIHTFAVVRGKIWQRCESYNEVKSQANLDNVSYILLFTHTDALWHQYFCY